LTIIILGYILFVKGLYKDSGEMQAQWKDFKIVIRKAAAGTYFVIFGSIIIAYTIYEGLSSEETHRKIPNAAFHIIPSDSTKILNDSLKIK
jgi:hypothetical protein